MQKINFSFFFFILSLVAMGEQASPESIEESIGTPYRISVTDHFLFSNEKESNEATAPSTQIYRNELKVNGEYGILGADLRLSNRYTPNGDRGLNNYATLEKKTVSIVSKTWDVKLGDSNQELGKGIALSLYDNATFGLNNTLEGGSVHYRPDSWDAFIAAGRINTLKAPVTLNALPNPIVDKTVWVGLASLTAEPFKNTKTSGHFVATYTEPTDHSKFQLTRTFGTSVSTENLLEDLDFYGETNLFLTQSKSKGSVSQDPNGVASYASFVWSPTPYKVKLEIKDYREYNYFWNRVPTLEDELVSTQHNENITATRLYGERRIGESRATLYSSYLIGQDRYQATSLHHPVIGTKIPLPNHAEFEAKSGYRWMPGLNNTAHASVKGKIRTGKGEYLELELKKQFDNTDLNRLAGKIDRNIVNLTYTFSDNFNLTAGYEYRPLSKSDEGQHFPNLAATYKTGDFSTRAFVGQTGGGSQCSGGVCQYVPAYKGAMLDTTVSF